MSDLEKTPSTIEEGAIPTSTEQVEVNTETVNAPGNEDGVAEVINDINVETEREDEAAEEAAERSFHEMSKEELLNTLKGIVENGETQRHRHVASIKQAYHALRTREMERELNEFIDAGNAPEAFSASVDEQEYIFKDYLNQFKEARSKFLAEEEARLEENLKTKREILARMNDIVEDIDNINVHFPKFQELQAEFKGIKDVTPSAENDIWKEFQKVVELFYDRLKMNKELRDLDFRKNLDVKRGYIQQAQSLGEMADVVMAFRRLQELYRLWRETGPVAKEHRETIWAEFTAAATVVNKRHQQFFEERKAAERRNEEGKTQLCEEIEALDYSNLEGFSKWEEMTKQVLDIQARWKALGYASKKVNNQLFSRFRESCDKFFNAKGDYYKRIKEEFAANLEKKEALCERAEALAAEDNAGKQSDKMSALQAEWKTIGPVPRRQSDAVWQRFKTACNKYYEERKRQNSAVRKDENENMAAKRAIIEELKGIDIEATSRNEGIAQVRKLQAKWQSIGHVPFRMKDKLYAEYREQCDRIYNGYEKTRRQNDRADFEGRINDMATGDGKLSHERERLYRAYEQKRSELKTYENNLGFFNVKSKDGNSMVREMEKKIERIKNDLQELKSKIELIDDKMN